MDTPRTSILVVDDDVVLCRAMKRVLHREDVVTCHDSQVALELLHMGHPFDVVICDISMPGKDGTEFAADIERTRPDLAGHVLFMTGGIRDERGRALANAYPTILKPASPAELRAAIKALSGQVIRLAS